MSYTKTWHVNTLDRETATGRVVCVHYSVVCTDGTYTSTANGTVGLNGEVTIPYSNITESITIGWVQDALAEQIPAESEDGVARTQSDRRALAVDAVEDALELQVAEQAAPTRAYGTPW